VQKSQVLQTIATVNNATVFKYNHERGQTEIEEKRKDKKEEEV